MYDRTTIGPFFPFDDLNFLKLFFYNELIYGFELFLKKFIYKNICFKNAKNIEVWKKSTPRIKPSGSDICLQVT